MSKNYYETLGVDKKANKDEIKKAFHKLAHKYHPDKKGGDAAKFKEVSEAYSVLSDDKKRAEYDSYGQTFANGAGPGAGGFGFDFSGFNGFDPEDFAGNVGDIFGDLFGGGRQRTPRGHDISTDLELTFEEAIFGIERKVLLNKTALCDTCHGSGGKPGTEQVTCSTCNGNGKIRENKRSIFGAVSVVATCSTCKGSGKVPKEKCTTCKGVGALRKQEEIIIAIPAGIDNGEVVRLTGAGEAMPGGIAGDLYVKIHVKKHKTLRKEGNNLAMNLNVKLSDALLGGSYTIESLDGPLTVTIPEGINFGEILRLKNKGVPVDKSRRGDLLVHVSITLPQKLSKRAKEKLEELRKEGI